MRHDEVAHCAAFEREWAAFAESDLGRALADLEQAVKRVRAELARRKPPPEAEEARRKMALNFIATDVLQGQPIETLSADELELLQPLFAIWRTATSSGLQEGIAHALLNLRLAGIVVRTDETEGTEHGEANTYTLRARLN
jgi:hypothetical protein